MPFQESEVIIDGVSISVSSCWAPNFATLIWEQNKSVVTESSLLVAWEWEETDSKGTKGNFLGWWKSVFWLWSWLPRCIYLSKFKLYFKDNRKFQRVKKKKCPRGNVTQILWSCMEKFHLILFHTGLKFNERSSLTPLLLLHELDTFYQSILIYSKDLKKNKTPYSISDQHLPITFWIPLLIGIYFQGPFAPFWSPSWQVVLHMLSNQNTSVTSTSWFFSSLNLIQCGLAFLSVPSPFTK